MPAGYILHGDGTSVDTAIGLFWDRSLRFLGVGTTSPAADLNINSNTTTPTMAFSQSFSNTSAQRGSFAFYNNSNSTVATIIAQAVTDNVGTDLEFYTRPVGGSLTKNMVLKESGRLGIGTASPSGKLHIKGAAASWNLFGEASDGSQLYGFYEDAGAGQLQLMDASGVVQINLQARAGQNNYINGGNVGIGTTTPTFKLDVNGTGRFSGALSGTSATFSADVTSIGASQNLFIADGTTYSGLRLNRAGVAKWGIFNNNAGTDFLDFYWYGSSPGTKFKIEPTGAATFSSSVAASANIKVTSVNGNEGLTLNNTTATTGKSWGLNSYDNGNLYFQVSNTNPVYFTPLGAATFSGSVSVGGATPTTSGSGITFPATQSPSTNPNTLDDYEEGSFSVQLKFGGNNTGYTFYGNAGVFGKYTKIGDVVCVTIMVGILSKAAGASTGNATITGLPFTSASNGVNLGGGINISDAISIDGASFYMTSNSTTLILQNGNGVNLTDANFGAFLGEIHMNFVYQVN
jgi:hypothetical protein